jgi:hypothetical protein
MKKRPGVSFSGFLKNNFGLAFFIGKTHFTLQNIFFPSFSQFLLQYKEKSPQEKSMLLVFKQPKAILKIN